MKRFFPLLALLILMGAAYWLGAYELFSFEKLKADRENLVAFVERYPLLSPFVYLFIYTVSTALSIPGAVFLSIFGGFIFPQPFSTIYVVIAATMGAMIIFLVAKTALGEVLKERAGGALKKMEKGFQENAASYLLFLRLVPLFPFWLVNLAPAFFGVTLFTFTWTTFVGIIPGAFVFTQAGVGLGAVFDEGETLNMDAIFNIEIKIALAALALFALIPVVIKKLKSNF